MKMFSFKNLLGIAAIGGAVAYARKHGGFKNAYHHLMNRVDELGKGELKREQRKGMGQADVGGIGTTASPGGRVGEESPIGGGYTGGGG